MDEKLVYWTSVVLSALALILLVTNVSLISGNRNLQGEVNQRQQVISNGVNMGQLNQALVQALADASVKNEDSSIKDLLAAQGITIKPKDESKDDTKKK